MRAPRRPPPLAGVPWDHVQDAMGVQPAVIIAGVLGLLLRHAQDAMRRQVLETTGGSGGLPPIDPQDAMEASATA
jgi:hypothetical protein